MPKNLVASKLYKDLIIAVKSALFSGLLAAQKALEYQRLKTYWTIGRDIRRAADSSDGALVLGEDLYQDINRDIFEQIGLDLKPDTIRRSIQLSRVYPKFPKNTPLTFTHYLSLMRVADPKLRLRLEKKASKEGMSTDQLIDAVRRINQKSISVVAKNIEKLAFERGELFVYRIYSDSDLGGKKSFRVDCGFKINVALNGGILREKISTASTQCRIVRVVKEGGVYSVRLSRRKELKPYTYSAEVTRVVDGDTIDVHIDVGFGIGLNERLRLKGINASEIDEQDGKRAKRFLAEYLSKCPVIVIRTAKEGMYGRWIADIFAMKRCRDPHKIAAQGEYINQLLIDKGLATIY